MNLLAFAIIAEVDDIYCKSLKNHLGRYLVEEGSLNFSKLCTDNQEPLYVNRAHFSQICKAIYRLFKVMYDSIYFYFAPYLVVALSFLIN